MSETWIINEKPVMPTNTFLTSISFVSKGKKGKMFVFGTMSNVPIITYYWDDALSTYSCVYTSSPSSWSNDAYRTVTFETAPTGDLLTWFQENAVKQVTYKFAHYYRNEKLVGTGSYKFRRYSTINYKLRAPVLSLSGDKLSIVAVDSINEYAKDFKLSAVKTSGGTTTNVIVAKTVDTYNLPGDLIADDATGSYYITAILEANEPYVDSNESNKLTYTLKARLATPTNVTSSMTTITWNAVANAGSYKVYMDNVLYQADAGTANEVNYVFNDTLSSDTNSDSTAFTCGGKSYTKMIYTYASASSNALLYYDSNNVATTVYSNGSWVSGTYKYLKFVTKPSGRWFVTNGTFATSTYSYDISTNSLWENAIDGVHSFTIVATGNSSYRDSLQSDAVLITKSSQTQLATPQNVSIDGTTLSWDEVENATSYDIYADGTLIGNIANNIKYDVDVTYGSAIGKDGTIYLKFDSDTVSSSDYDVTKFSSNPQTGTTPENFAKIAYVGDIAGAGSITLWSIYAKKSDDGVTDWYNISDVTALQSATNGTQAIGTTASVYDIKPIFDYFNGETDHGYTNVTKISLKIRSSWRD